MILAHHFFPEFIGKRSHNFVFLLIEFSDIPPIWSFIKLMPLHYGRIFLGFKFPFCLHLLHSHSLLLLRCLYLPYLRIWNLQSRHLVLHSLKLFIFLLWLKKCRKQVVFGKLKWCILTLIKL